MIMAQLHQELHECLHHARHADRREVRLCKMNCFISGRKYQKAGCAGSRHTSGYVAGNTRKRWCNCHWKNRFYHFPCQMVESVNARMVQEMFSWQGCLAALASEDASE